MYFSAIFTLITAVVWATASPVSSITKREVGGILICQGANATGTCSYDIYSLDTCHDVPANLSGNASTFAPDGDSFYCYPKAGQCSDVCTSPEGCTLGAVNFYSPVKYDLATVGWNTLLYSFECYLNTTTTR